MEQITGLDYQIQEMASRIRALREIEGLSAAEMAQKTGITRAISTSRSCTAARWRWAWT